MDSSDSVDSPRPEPQVASAASQASVPEPVAGSPVEEPYAPTNTGPEPPGDEPPAGRDIGETFAGLLESAVEFVRAVLDWVEERTRTIVKDRVAKPMAVAIVVGLVGGTMLASLVGVVVCLLFGGLVILLAKLVGYGLAALLVGFLGTAIIGIVLWRMWAAVMPDEQAE